MTNQIPQRQTAFILTSTIQGTYIVNKNDYAGVDDRKYGVGHDLLEYGHYDINDISLAINLLTHRAEKFGQGVVAIDCGANIGVHTIEWAKVMTGWGFVFSFEPQEHIYYALAGNIILNNCFNVKAINIAIGEEDKMISIPKINYLKNASYGSFEIKKSHNNEFIGQDLDYENNLNTIEQVAIDSFKFDRVDFIKIDVEGMEINVLNGALQTIKDHKPYLLIERIKTNESELKIFLENLDYEILEFGKNFLAVQKNDSILDKFKK